MPRLILYYKPTCPFCQKVLNFIKQKEISLRLKNIDESSKIRQELISIGGKQQVPCLIINGKALYESDKIIDWIDETSKA